MKGERLPNDYVTSSHDYVIDPATISDSGDYACTASYASGRVATTIVTAYVQGKFRRLFSTLLCCYARLIDANLCLILMEQPIKYYRLRSETKKIKCLKGLNALSSDRCCTVKLKK